MSITTLSQAQVQLAQRISDVEIGDRVALDPIYGVERVLGIEMLRAIPADRSPQCSDLSYMTVVKLQLLSVVPNAATAVTREDFDEAGDHALIDITPEIVATFRYVTRFPHEPVVLFR